MITEQYMLLSLVAGYREYSFLKHSTRSKFQTLRIRYACSNSYSEQLRLTFD